MKVRVLGFEPRLIGWKPIVLAVGHYTRMMYAVARVGFEPTASLVLSQSGLPVAYRAV